MTKKKKGAKRTSKRVQSPRKKTLTPLSDPIQGLLDQYGGKTTLKPLLELAGVLKDQLAQYAKDHPGENTGPLGVANDLLNYINQQLSKPGVACPQIMDFD